MSELKMLSDHIADATLWQWRGQELDEAAATSVQRHLQSCRSCQQRAEAVTRLMGEMKAAHHAIQPTLAEQMRLMRALEAEFISAETPGALVSASRGLVRWLAPAVAVLALLFILLRQETAPSSDALTTLLSETPESRLLLASTEEQFQQVMLELAFSETENAR